MKGKTLSAIGVLAAVAGAVLIICFRSITSDNVVVTGGILFVAVGMVNLVFIGQSQQTSGVARVLGQIANSAAIVLGICLLVFKATFIPLVSFIFGLLVAICALWQFFVLALGCRPVQMPGWLYVFPLLLAGGAAYIFFKGDSADHVVMLATGISAAVLGGACLLEGSILGVARRRAARHTPDTEGDRRSVPEAETAPANATESEAAGPRDTAEDDSQEVTTDLDAPLERPKSQEK